MLVSFIIPFFNREQFLERSIRSVYNQGLPEHSFELILIDDGSTDQSLAIARRFTPQTNNVKIFSQQNKGAGFSRNVGLQAAQGQYIQFLDSDDWLEDNTTGSILKIMQQMNLDILEFNANIRTPQGKIIRRKLPVPHEVNDGLCYGNLINSTSSCNKLYAKKLLDQHRVNFCNETYGEDLEFNARAFFFARRVFAIDIAGINFYQSPNSLTRNNHADAGKIVGGLYGTLVHLFKFKNNIEHISAQQAAFLDVRLSEIVYGIVVQSVKRNRSIKDTFQIIKKLKAEKLYYTATQFRDLKRFLFCNIFIKHPVLLYVSLIFKVGKRNKQA